MIGILRGLIVSFAVITALLLPGVTTSAAVELYPQGACGNTGGTSDMCTKGGEDSLDSMIQGIVNILLYVAGAIAVLFILFGGFRFVTSAGDASKAASARNTILYAAIGLAAVALSFAIANIVLGRIMA